MLTVTRNSGERLAHVFYVDGVATAADGAVTVGIAKADSTALVNPGTATTFDSATKEYRYILAPQAALNFLTPTWTGAFGGVVMSQQDQVELVGGVYCSVFELSQLDGLSTTPIATLANRRREFESLAERYNGVAWVPRFAREAHPGRWNFSQLLNRPRARTILSCSATDPAGVTTVFSTTNWRVSDQGLLVTDGDYLVGSIFGERNITIEYEHGHDNPPPELVQACKDYVAAKVLQSANRHARDLLSETNPAGFSQHWSTPDWDAGRPTGLLDVDDVLNSLGRAAMVA